MCSQTVSYVDKNLLPNEVVRYRATLHWSVFLTLHALLTLFIGAWLRRRTSEFAVTNKRVVIKQGIIGRHTLELNLSKVESVGVEQSLWGRMFGSGKIVVQGTGGTREVFAGIANPVGFRHAVQEAIDASSRAAG
jgi:uncharacterized membrane protein YdbT with pleckstrin-like domain